MAAFNDIAFDPDQFRGTLRLFPLPNLVLFPHVMQPLHIFEPRYRDLLREALADDRLIGMATLAAGWESDYEGRPPLFPTVCVGRIAASHELRDGSSNLLLMGVCRGRPVRELPPTRLFREAKIELLPDVYPTEQDAVRGELRQQLYEAFAHVLPSLPQIHEQLNELIGGDTPLGELTDIVGYALDLGIEQKQILLTEASVDKRAEILLDHRAVATIDTTVGPSGVLNFPPGFSAN